MQIPVVGIAMLVFGGFVAAAAAQETGQVDVSRLPIDVNRIQKQLRQTIVREEHESPFRLRYVVDVYGIAPRIEIFTDKNVSLQGPVPWAAPTHRDLLEVITPKEYRAPAADFGALSRWLADKAAGRSTKR